MSWADFLLGYFAFWGALSHAIVAGFLVCVLIRWVVSLIQGAVERGAEDLSGWHDDDWPTGVGS